MKRNWDEVWLTMCDAIAMRSKCYRRQVGAVVVTREQEFVAAGYNGAPPGYPEPTPDCRGFCTRATTDDVSRTYWNCIAVHAELNALVRAGHAPRGTRTLYVSSAVCMECAKVAPSAGVGRVVMRVDAQRDAHRDPSAVRSFLQTCGVEVAWVPD